MRKRFATILLCLLLVLTVVSACGKETPQEPVETSTETPAQNSASEPPAQEAQAEEPVPLYDEAPSRYTYGVFLNKYIGSGNALSDYSVAFNNFADRTAYAFYSEQGLTPLSETFADLPTDTLAAMEQDKRAFTISSNDGFHDIPEDLMSFEGKTFDSSEKDKFYYLYVAYDDGKTIFLEKCGDFITPAHGPSAPEKYSASSVGAIVPAGGATSFYDDSSSYSPGYIDALKHGAKEAGIAIPRIAVIETTVGTESEMYDDMFIPPEDDRSFSDVLRDDGFEPVYIPLGIDNYEVIQNNPYFADLIRSCHIVLFTGGDQAYYGLALADRNGAPSLAAQAICDVITNGGTLGGSSAGAAAMSGIVLTNGAPGSYQPFYWNEAETVDINRKYTAENIADNTTVNEGNNMLYQSIGFVEPVLGKDILLDTHVDARGRVGRLVAGLRDSSPSGIGIAMDETAGIRIDGESRKGTVFGTSGVYIINAKDCSWAAAGEIGGFGAEGLILNYLTAGDVYDFNTDTVIPSPDKKELNGSIMEAYLSEDVFGTDEMGTTVMSFAQSAETSVDAMVSNVSIQPYLSGNSFTVRLTKENSTECFVGDPFPDEDYFGEFLMTCVSGMKMDIISGPSTFDPSAAGGFEILSASTEDNLYAVNVLFSGPISVGYEGNNKYFLDCEDPDNIPTDYVEVYDAGGNPKDQDRTYTFRINDENSLRIVLVDDVYYEEGDTIIVKPTIVSLYGEVLEEGAEFKLENGNWIMQ